MKIILSKLPHKQTNDVIIHGFGFQFVSEEAQT